MSRQPREVEQDAIRNGEGRKERVPLGGFRQKLAVSNIPRGYVGRWINDQGARIQEALAAGYEFVQDEAVLKEQAGKNVESDTRVSRIVDQSTGRRAYLMMIREEFYREDHAAKQKSLDEIDAVILRKAEEGGGMNPTEPGARYSKASIERG